MDKGGVPVEENEEELLRVELAAEEGLSGALLQLSALPFRQGE